MENLKIQSPSCKIVANPKSDLSIRSARRLKHALTLEDFEVIARSYLPRAIFGYIAGATETQTSLKDNRRVFDEIAFRAHTLVKVADRTQETTLFGQKYSAPFGIAPIGFSALLAYRGDITLGRGAMRSNIPMIMSGASLISMEDAIAELPDVWFQAYLTGDEVWIGAFIDRIVNAGIKTLVVTVDMAVVSNREHDLRNGFSAPLKPTAKLAIDGLLHPGWLTKTFVKTIVKHGMPHFENFGVEQGPTILSRKLQYGLGGRDHLNWSHVAFIRNRWKGRLILKGIMSVHDARLARDAGVDGIIVSNHGGRQLDYLPSPLRVLPDIADAIGGAIPVMIDSGFRRGTDVLKAIALGADFVFVGRPFIYAAAVAGEAGVEHAFRLLSSEIHSDMALIGINKLTEMTKDRLMDFGKYI